jgi:peptidylprolyl isomerase
MKKYLYITNFLLITLLISCANSQSDLSKGLYAEIKTNKGDIMVNLNFKETPVTVANFVSLSEGKNKEVSPEYNKKKYYDGLIFHRVIDNFMIQGGCPQGNGMGDPGYKFKDEFNENLNHDGPGVLSMANSGPNSNGSQFFITHKETPWLNGVHSVFGRVIKGIEVVNLIKQNDTIENISIIRVGREARSFKASKIFSNHFEEDKINKEKKIALLKNIKLGKSKEHETKKSMSISTNSGLQYIKTHRSNGPKVDPKKAIMTHYAVYFEDGSLLDTSILEVAEQYDIVNLKRKNAEGYSPLECRVGPDDQLIPGFKEGLRLLNVGDKAIIYIPYYLAYGEAGRGSMIPPKSNLIFEVEIVELK